MNTRLFPALACALALLTLAGCGSDDPGVDPATIATPSATSSILDLPGEDEAGINDEDEEEAEEAETGIDPTVALAQVTATKISTKLTKKVDWGTEESAFYVGAKDSRNALSKLPYGLDRTHRIAFLVVTSGYATFCVENVDGLAYAYATVTETDESMAVAAGACPQAEVDKAIFERDQTVAAAKAEKARKAAEKREKKQDRKAEKKAEAAAAEAEAAGLLESVEDDASFTAGMLTGKIDVTATGKPGKDDIRSVDTVVEVNKVLTANGTKLTGDNTVGSVKFTGKGFIICVQAGDEGPSATHNSVTGQTDANADSGCA